MPRHPQAAASVAGIRGSVFSALAHRLASYRGEVYPFHVGDTWLEPAEGCRMQDLSVDDHPGMHRYAPPQGMPALIDRIVERAQRRTGVATERSNVLVTAGATGALGSVMGAILDPGDEVLVLAPYWPLITGIVRCFHGRPIEVPLVGLASSADEAVARVQQHLGPRTAALYLSTPNNPTGFVLPPGWVQALTEWAAGQDLWIVTDEVYEDYVYEGSHTYARALAPERTFSAHSFSKAFGMAGNRCGYVVGPSRALPDLCKVSTHAFYSAPTASQIAGCRVLDGRGDAWIGRVRGLYADAGRDVARRLGVDPPAGSTFLFLDVASRLDQRGLAGFLEDCADRGLFLAPGTSFGSYPTHVRLCFTSAPPDVVKRGAEVLAALLGR
jgi:N-succinyldiaminopimelate aminotransferase